MSQDLLAATTTAVRDAGARMLARYSPAARQSGLAELLESLHDNDSAITDVLRPALTALRPEARWLDDEHGSGPLPAGEPIGDPIGAPIGAPMGEPYAANCSPETELL